MFQRHIGAANTSVEQHDLFGPVADLMVGVIFIFIILLIALTFHLQPEDLQQLRDRIALLEEENQRFEEENRRLEEDNRRLEEENQRFEEENRRLKEFVRYVRDEQLERLFQRLAAAAQTRAELLSELKRRLEEVGIQVTIDSGNGTLKLPSGGLFLPGQAVPTREGQKILQQLGEVLAVTLPCYVPLPGSDLALSRPANCPELDAYSSLSAVYLEGHSDIVPVGMNASRFRDNWELSAARAIETYRHLNEQFPLLQALRNLEGDTLLGVSGYAETRPATSEPDRLSEAVRDQDRRIEVRLIMTANPIAVRNSIAQFNQRLEAVNELIQ